MTFDLFRSKYISKLANVLYDWLPGSNPPYSQQTTFGSIASEFRLEWIGGSKLPALIYLLEQAENKAFLSRLVMKIISEGIKYREKKGNVITKGEIDTISSIMIEIGYKIPELMDEKFTSSFHPGEPNQYMVDRVKLAQMSGVYQSLKTYIDSQSRGYDFQTFIKDLFKLWALEPRKSFRRSGSEIDGSIELNNEIYLIEARWRTKLPDKNDLRLFSDKIDETSIWTRGIFISATGFSEDVLDNFAFMGRINFIAMSGHEIENVLSGKNNLIELLRKKVRISAEESRFYLDNS